MRLFCLREEIFGCVVASFSQPPPWFSQWPHSFRMYPLDLRDIVFTKGFVGRIQLNVPPTNDGVPSKGSNSTLLQPCPPPRPPGLPKLRPDARSHPFNTPIPGDGQRRTPIIINHWQLLCIAIALLTLVLPFMYDPLASIIDVESAKQRASIQNATLLFEREKTEREREVVAREKELWEKAREAHVPRGAFWDVVWPAWDCLAYGKREYWGILRNIPKDWDPVDACMDMPVEIKGVKIRRPKWCEGRYDLLDFQTRGHWVVDWDQPDCRPWYRDFEDRVRPNFPFVPLRIFPHTPLIRGVRAITPGNVESKLRLWASTTREDKTGACCVPAHPWSGTWSRMQVLYVVRRGWVVFRLTQLANGTDLCHGW